MPLSTREERAEVDGLKTMTLSWGRVGEGEEDGFGCICAWVFIASICQTHTQSDTSQTPSEMERVIVDSNPLLLGCLK